MELIVFFVWGGVGAPGFREKFASWVENERHGEEKECSLENGAYLFVLVYLGRAKSKNLPRGRDDKYELEETFSSVPTWMVLTICGLGFGLSIFSEFDGW